MGETNHEGNMEQATIALVYTTCPTRDDAQFLADTLLEKKLAACINFWPIESKYWWQEGEQTEKLEYETEVALFCKTAVSAADSLIKEIIRTHPYEVPCIELFRIETTSQFAAYVAGCVRPAS